MDLTDRRKFQFFYLYIHLSEYINEKMINNSVPFK
uniref:Uncharacterized protein n=1 Tax=viral metagenome TaxID=1070528 RepID=A0A6C0EB09_9ZZZZ